jgi:orotidine-5'-phosphate decarboxylase
MAEIIVALDHGAAAEALSLVDRLGEVGTFYKVGLVLYTHAGPDVVRALHDRGKRVFLDLKLHDIPNTVSGAVRAAAALDVAMLTVHTGGGEPMLRAGVEAAEARVKLLGVTVLTSLTASDVEQVWGREIRSIRDEVLRLAQLAAEVELDGVVASAVEAGWIRPAIGADMLIVTPGIRLDGTDRGDQKRVSSPADAVSAGADYLVVGRPITQSADPVAALRRLVEAAVSAGAS